MVRGAWCVATLGVLLGVGARGANAQEDEIGIPRGATPPAVTIEDLDGRAVDLAQWVGRKPVLIEFWATWCPTCEALLPKMEAAHRHYGSQVEFIVVAVAVNQSQSTIKRHLERHAMPFRFLWDTNGNAVRAFQAPATSYVVVLDAEGRVVYTGLGSDQDVEAALKRSVEVGQGR
jgi:thiol-disulfide isomerase/thioredoxin